MPLPPPTAPAARSLYLYENRGIWAFTVLARAGYLYENRGIWAFSLLARALYLYENRALQALALLARALYLHEATTDGEVFPWLNRIVPTEQYRGGTVDLYGDGFGELAEVAAGSTITTDSVSGSNIGTFAVDRSTNSWVSTGGAGAWIRFTFSAPKTITYIALEAATAWGVPLFKFSDGGPDVNGGVAVPAGAAQGTEYPVGAARALYAMPTPRTTTYVEVRIASGGGGARGLYEAWIFEDLDQAAEGSSAVLNAGLLSEEAMGIVAWANRSPGLWPANGGLPVTPAATVTLPADAVSGLVDVKETV